MELDVEGQQARGEGGGRNEKRQDVLEPLLLDSTTKMWSLRRVRVSCSSDY